MSSSPPRSAQKEPLDAAKAAGRDSRIYKNVLDSMDEGVMTVSSDGHIKTFNLAASRMLGLSPEEVLGKAYAEAFLTLKGMEDFSEAVMAAVYDKAVGQQQVVKVHSGDETVRTFALTTSYFQEVGKKKEEGGRFDVTAVFSDITETEKLREAELRLTESVKEQHTKLQDAYREMEENNQALSSALKKVQVARVTATVFVIVVFLVSGFYAWNTGSQSVADGGGESLPPAGASVPAAELSTVVLVPQQLKSELSFTGQLTPLREVSVVSPVDGNVAATHFQYGEQVVAGQRLVDLDTTEAEQRYREAQAAYIKALKRFEEIENWESSYDVLRSQRQVHNAKQGLEAAKSKLDETAFLLEMGIIPASEHKAAGRQHDSQQTTYESALQDLEAVLSKGGRDARKIARLEFDNARERMQAMEEVLGSATINAPVTGIVLKSKEGAKSGNRGSGKTGGLLVKGQSVTQGGFLLTIGDLDGLSVTGQVDEVNVAKIRVGQKTRVSGDAFPNLDIEGEIVHVSSQATESSGGGIPTFKVTAAIRNLDEEQWQHLRLGMSANIVVVIWEKLDALLVPLSAVRKKEGRYWVSVRRGEGDTVEPVPVEIGMTTVDSVEVLHGLKAGDEVVVAGI